MSGQTYIPTVRVAYYAHCDEGECSLGSAQYRCPLCGMDVFDYGEGWFDRYEEDKTFLCANCDKRLEREY